MKLTFDLGGYVNKQNCRIWGTGNPHAYIDTFGQSADPKSIDWSRNWRSPLSFIENSHLAIGPISRWIGTWTTKIVEFEKITIYM